MRITPNLSFFLCISSVAIPVTDARANGFDRKRSAATKRSIEHQRQKVFDFAAQQESRRELKAPVTESSVSVHQQRRRLQADWEQGDGALKLCEAFIEALIGPNSGCKCDEEGDPTSECQEYLSECNVCDTIQGQRTCLVFAAEETSAAISEENDADCYSYNLGPFDNTICTIDNVVENTCTVTIDGEECNSCAIVACGATDGEGVLSGSYDFDCSNVMKGETWNLCTDNIPETSPFLASGNNNRYLDLECGSGGFATSLHTISVLISLIAVAAFW
jgi:hypothetical protein